MGIKNPEFYAAEGIIPKKYTENKLSRKTVFLQNPP
jgi:hypothetical protein